MYAFHTPGSGLSTGNVAAKNRHSGLSPGSFWRARTGQEVLQAVELGDLSWGSWETWGSADGPAIAILPPHAAFLAGCPLTSSSKATASPKLKNEKRKSELLRARKAALDPYFAK